MQLVLIIIQRRPYIYLDEIKSPLKHITLYITFVIIQFPHKTPISFIHSFIVLQAFPFPLLKRENHGEGMKEGKATHVTGVTHICTYKRTERNINVLHV